MKNSDETAFNELYDRTWQKLYLTARAKTNNEGLAKELIQDIFIDFWDKKHIREIKDVKAYLNQTLRFKIIDIYRSKKLDFETLDDIENILIESTSSDKYLIERELNTILNYWMKSLPLKRRKIFELYYFENKSTKEISETLQLSIKTVQNQLISSKSSLKGVLQKILFILFVFFFRT
ncbi:sigma-70 family RNA polymerase sigma factor [Sphingobacterium sp. WM]|uniref:RNA polymerase sigma factor n=1 Tax=Sphingobacterium TaxID=28453 RepID=UPI0015C661B3|nr:MULTISPECIES: sigma-70 family RNA polymerase sigma factor [Sphingobacterium]WFB63311.1 sigma-70 family RNA polymerase sigma factor [Sphingobacterium sp. WM]